MLLALRYLLDRLTGPRSRADELRVLRRRLARQGAAGKSLVERRLALTLRDLRERLVTRLGHVQACRRCGHSPAWPGGQCCSASTSELFSDHELGALRLAGTTPSRLRPPGGAHDGCAFRGSSGCSLPATHRPSVCVGYACRELLVELRQRGDERAIARLQGELQVTFRRFAAERAARLEADMFDELEAGLLACRPPASHGDRTTR